MIELSNRYLVGYTHQGPIYFDLTLESPEGNLYRCSEQAAIILTAHDRCEWVERRVVAALYNDETIVVTRDEAALYSLNEADVIAWN